MKIVLLWMFCQFPSTYSCRSSLDAYPIPQINPTTTTMKNLPKLFNDQQQWNPHPSDFTVWNKYYEDWLRKQELQKKIDEEGLEKGIVDPDDGTKPRLWTQIPPGRNGDDPPPWAIAAKGQGKPHYCFQPPDEGVECTRRSDWKQFAVIRRTLRTRWGFNYFKGECEAFKFTDCGGNDNNFLSKRRCEEACLKIPSTLCQNYGGRRYGTILAGKPGC